MCSLDIEELLQLIMRQFVRDGNGAGCDGVGVRCHKRIVAGWGNSFALRAIVWMDGELMRAPPRSARH